MRAVILTQKTMLDKTLFDVRYFYRDQYIWSTTCGLALKTLVAVHRQHDNNIIHDISAWYQAVSTSPNVTVLGFLVERICLDAIQRGALRTVDKQLDHELKRYTFQDIPPVDLLIASKSTCCLYVPLEFNFADIDAAVIWVDRVKLKAHVYPIQVTIAKTHQDSETSFYQSQWPHWKTKFPADYAVSSTFIWVDMKEPSTKDKPALTRDTRARTVVVVDVHESKHMSIETMEPILYNHVTERLQAWK